MSVRTVLECILKETGFYPSLKPMTSMVPCEKENCKNAGKAVVRHIYLVLYMELRH